MYHYARIAFGKASHATPARPLTVGEVCGIAASVRVDRLVGLRPATSLIGRGRRVAGLTLSKLRGAHVLGPTRPGSDVATRPPAAGANRFLRVDVLSQVSNTKCAQGGCITVHAGATTGLVAQAFLSETPGRAYFCSEKIGYSLCATTGLPRRAMFV